MLIAPPLSPAELLLKTLAPMNVTKTLDSASIAPPNFAKLPVNLLVPLKESTASGDVLIAPPSPLFTWLPMKLLVPVKVSTALCDAKIAPPSFRAELLIKLLVP